MVSRRLLEGGQGTGKSATNSSAGGTRRSTRPGFIWGGVTSGMSTSTGVDRPEVAATSAVLHRLDGPGLASTSPHVRMPEPRPTDFGELYGNRLPVHEELSDRGSVLCFTIGVRLRGSREDRPGGQYSIRKTETSHGGGGSRSHPLRRNKGTPEKTTSCVQIERKSASGSHAQCGHRMRALAPSHLTFAATESRRRKGGFIHKRRVFNHGRVSASSRCVQNASHSALWDAANASISGRSHPKPATTRFNSAGRNWKSSRKPFEGTREQVVKGPGGVGCIAVPGVFRTKCTGGPGFASTSPCDRMSPPRPEDVGA